jgi:hypothetical protein
VSDRRANDRTGAALGLAAVAAVVCCIGPLLVAGGAIATIGGVLLNPYVVAAGVALCVISLAIGFARHRATKTCRVADESGSRTGVTKRTGRDNA